MKVVVFGGSGFIGSHVCDVLRERGIEPIIFDRFPHVQMAPVARVFYGDIKDKEAVLEAVGLSDGAINLAGILGTSETVNNPYPSVDVNIIGGLNFLEACRHTKKRGVQITVGNHFMNNSYAITKTATERFALMYNKEHATRVAVVRGLNAYGPRQKHKPVRKIIPNFVIRALRGDPIEIYGKGESIMDMIFVKDVAEILVRALLDEHNCYDKIFEAGTGVETTVNEIANMVNKITDNKAGVKHLPMRQGEPEQSIVLGSPSTLLPLKMSGGNLKTLFEGLKETVDWYKNNYNLDEI